MPYARGVGDYYQGDNYAAGGLFSFVGNIAKKLIGATPIGAVASALIPSFNKPQIAPARGFGPGPSIVPTPGLTGFGQRLIPGGASGYMLAPRRRMNVTNVKALRRAGRRVKGFLRLASRLGALPVSRGKSRKLFQRKRK